MLAKKKAKTPPKRKTAKPQKITFFYIKSNQHHVAHIDGAIGTISPQGFVVASLYSERFAIPTETTHSLIDGTGVKGVPEEIKGKKGIVREIDVTATLTPESAKRIGEWLIAKAKEVEIQIERATKAPQEGDK